MAILGLQLAGLLMSCVLLWLTWLEYLRVKKHKHLRLNYQLAIFGLLLAKIIIGLVIINS